MQSMQNRLKGKLSELYDEIKTEFEFDLSIDDLIDKRRVWKTDILHHLRRACRYLLTADVCEFTKTERIGQQLLAELMVRHLIVSLKAELTEFHDQVASIPSASPVEGYGLSRNNTYTNREFDAKWDNHVSETEHRRFIRTGDRIEVMVDHRSETNFFSDLSSDPQIGGLFVATYDILSVGKRLNVRLALPGSGLFQIQGTVTWVREADNCSDEDISPGMGISFSQLNPESTRAIEQFMSERQPLLFAMS